jgi:hypothetical protein
LIVFGLIATGLPLRLRDQTSTLEMLSSFGAWNCP